MLYKLAQNSISHHHFVFSVQTSTVQYKVILIVQTMALVSSNMYSSQDARQETLSDFFWYLINLTLDRKKITFDVIHTKCLRAEA